VSDLPIWESRIHDQDGSSVVALTGELDLDGADEICKILIGRLDQTGSVVADLSAVTFLDSAALGALIRAFQHAQDIHRDFAVTGAVPGVRRIMQIAGVYDLLSPAVAGTET
jgi:anti-anti-sigma factor